MNRGHHFSGLLIAIEGIDGAGKTTLAHFVQERLQSKKLCVIRTKEPTMGDWGQLLRDSALTGRLSLDEEVDAFIKDRKEHVETVINPSLHRGHIVVADRYYFSTMAYQGARGMDPEDLMRRNELFAPEPDMLVILDIDPKLGQERVRTRGDRADHFEKTDSLSRAREIFFNIKKPYMFRLDATLKPEVLRDLVVNQFLAMYGDRVSQLTHPAKAERNLTLDLFGSEAN